jgi:AraC family transcriptional regulator, arabinose operon regulatory protein
MDANFFSLLTDEERKAPFYIASAGGWENQEYIDRPEGYTDFQWIQTVQGEGVLRLQGKEMAVSKGQGMFLLPGEPHMYYARQEPWSVRWVTFQGRQARQLLDTLGLNTSQVLYTTHPDTLLSKIHSIIAMLSSADPMRNTECSALVYRIVLDLFHYSSPSEVRSKQQHYEQLEPILHLIDKKYREPITLAELAEQVMYSQQYTCHLFQQAMGMRPFEYITKYRLLKAKELLLRHPKLDVKLVAREVGYEHPSYFIKLFKREEGVTPNAFRRIHLSSDAGAKG